MMKLRIIKEQGVFRIQSSGGGKKWVYAEKAIRTMGIFSGQPVDFKTQEEAEKFIEHNYMVIVVKDYDVEDN